MHPYQTHRRVSANRTPEIAKELLRPKSHMSRLPPAVKRTRSDVIARACPAHRAWVRRHHCCVEGCFRLPIECAHVRGGTDGGMALKPSDKWVISLCRHHHGEQHQIGENAFAKRYGLDLSELAREFASRSPHKGKLKKPCVGAPILVRRS